MGLLKGIVAMFLILSLSLASGCASTEALEVTARQEQMLRDENDSLRKQMTDLSSIENALNKELGRRDDEIAALKKRNGDLAGRNGELQDRLQAQPGPKPTNLFPGSNDPNIEIINRPDGSVVLRIAGTVMFSSGRDELTKAGGKILDKVAHVLRDHPERMISVEGHTDAQPLKKTKELWGTNLALSLARALSVQAYLNRVKKIEEKRMRVVGWGEHKPVLAGASNAVHQKNRRVELVLYRPD